MTTTFFYVWSLWCACSFSGCEWAYCRGTLLCEFSIPKCGGVLGGNDQNRAEKQNVVLTWFRPVTWSSGHLGRRFWGKFPRLRGSDREGDFCNFPPFFGISDSQGSRLLQGTSNWQRNEQQVGGASSTKGDRTFICRTRTGMGPRKDCKTRGFGHSAPKI